MGICACAQSSLILWDLLDYSPPGFSVHGIFQARILEWVAIPTPGDLPDPGIKPTSPETPAFAGTFFTTEPLGKPQEMLWKGVMFGLELEG